VRVAQEKALSEQGQKEAERQKRVAIAGYEAQAVTGEVEAKRAQIRDLLGDARRGDDILYSTRILKKTGLRLRKRG